MAKIAFLINSMAGGGAERVVSILLKNLSRENRELFLIVLEDRFYYDIPSDVKVFKLSKKEIRSNFQNFLSLFSGTKLLKKIVRENKIDLVVSFLGRSNYINLMAKKAGHKSYISERVNPSQMHSFGGAGIFNRFLTAKLYPKADLIFTNSFGTRNSLSQDFDILLDKIKVIHNPIDIEKIQDFCQDSLEPEYQEIFKNPVIINVGRLNKQKDHASLIKSFKIAKDQIPKAKLLILGEGELENYLKNLAKKLGLENNILFLGWQKNPFKFLSRAKVFVLSSLWEGLPNTLIEALASGCPVISTDCPSGPDEIIEDGKNGLLVPLKDEKALAQAMVKILTDPSFAQELAQKGKERAKDFSVKNIIYKYERII